jgi:CBS domain-containing protein
MSAEENHGEDSTVEDYMNKRMITIDSKSSITYAIKTMAERNISSVAIIDTTNNDRIIGILTERDIVKLLANDVSPDAITIGSLMSSPLVTIDRNSSLEEAARLMIQKKHRHLLVRNPEDGEIIGIMTTTDLARYLKQKVSPRELASLLLEAMYPPEDGEKLFW